MEFSQIIYGLLFGHKSCSQMAVYEKSPVKVKDKDFYLN